MKRWMRWAGALALAAFGWGGAAAATQVVIGTGGTGGVYFYYGTQVAQLASKDAGVNATAIQTAASVDNMLLLRDRTNAKRGTYYCGTVLPDTALMAFEGKLDKFVGKPAPARILFVMYPNLLQIVTTADSGIKDLKDLAGKRVSTGAPSSGTEYSTLNFLKAAGVNPDTFSKWAKLGAGESADGLSNGTLDAYFWSGGIPTGSITELGTTLKRKGKQIALVSLDPKGKSIEDFEKEFPGLGSPMTIPAKVYGTEGDVHTFGFWNELVCPASLPDDVAYGVTKAVFTHLDELRQSVKAAHDTTVENNVEFMGKSKIPFHEGALRYFKEVGAAK